MLPTGDASPNVLLFSGSVALRCSFRFQAIDHFTNFVNRKILERRLRGRTASQCSYGAFNPLSNIRIRQVQGYRAYRKSPPLPLLSFDTSLD